MAKGGEIGDFGRHTSAASLRLPPPLPGTQANYPSGEGWSLRPGGWPRGGGLRKRLGLWSSRAHEVLSALGAEKRALWPCCSALASPLATSFSSFAISFSSLESFGLVTKSACHAEYSPNTHGRSKYAGYVWKGCTTAHGTTAVP